MNMSTNDSSISLELIPRIPNDSKIQVANNDIIRFYATAHTKTLWEEDYIMHGKYIQVLPTAKEIKLPYPFLTDIAENG